MRLKLLDNFDFRRHDLSIYFIIDGSSNMDGARIASVNDAIESLIPIFENVSLENPEINIILKVLLVNDTPKIILSSDVNGFVWQNVTASGDFYFGRALACLTEDVKRYFQPSNFDPIFILLTSSISIDKWQYYLKRLSNVSSFDYGHKIVIQIGDQVESEMLYSFTKCESHIFSVYNIDKLKDLMLLTWSYPEWEVSNGDDFEKCVGDVGLIIDKAIALFGKEIILDSRIINILNDYQAFALDRSKLFIIKTIQNDSKFKDLINSDNWYLDSVSFCIRMAQNTGIDIHKLQSVIDDIGFGLNQTIYKS